MPLPIPHKDETKDEFLTRCAEDDIMGTEFPETDQRIAVCNKLYDEQGKMSNIMTTIIRGDMPTPSLVAAFKQGKDNTFQWDAEVFAVGTWNGYDFSEKDLDDMIASFEALNEGGYLEVPLKFGHNDEQPITDGHPALGWVTKLYKKKDDEGRTKLMASLDNVPSVVYDAAKAGRYRKVSIELEFDVKHKGTMYPYVMTGIALLGADLPAVNTLADLNAYMGRDSMVASRKAVFSAVSGNISESEEENTMAEISDKELAELRAKAEKADKLEGTVANFERQQAEDKVNTARSSVNAILDSAVEEMRITPAQRVGFAKALRIEDDEVVVGITADDVEAMLPEKQKDEGGQVALGRAADAGASGDVTSNTDDELDVATRKIMAESGGKVKYARALEMAMQANPEVAKKHTGVGQ